MLQPAYEPLVRTNAEGELESALAESWDVSEDNKAVTFTLRQDAKFSDGEAVNATAAEEVDRVLGREEGSLLRRLLPPSNPSPSTVSTSSR